MAAGGAGPGRLPPGAGHRSARQLAGRRGSAPGHRPGAPTPARPLGWHTSSTSRPARWTWHTPPAPTARSAPPPDPVGVFAASADDAPGGDEAAARAVWW